MRSLAYDPVLEYLYIGTLDQGMFQLALKPQVIFHSSDHQKTIAIDHFGNVPIRLFNDALQIGSQKYNLGFFKREEVKFVSQNKNRLPKHEDFFYELNYDTPVASIQLYEIKKSDSHIWVNSNVGLFKFSPKGKFESYLPLHTLAFDFTPDNRLIETNPYHGVRIYETENPMSYKYYDEHSVHTPTDVVGTLRIKNRTFLLSIFKGLFSYSDKFRSFSADNIWLEKKLRHITTYKSGLGISQEFGDIYVVNVDEGFQVEHKINRKNFRGNTIFDMKSYEEWLIILTEAGITFTNFQKQIFLNEEQGLKQPIHNLHVHQDTLYAATDKGEFRMNLVDILHPDERIDDIFIREMRVNGNLISMKNKISLRSNQNHLEILVGTTPTLSPKNCFSNTNYAMTPTGSR